MSKAPKQAKHVDSSRSTSPKSASTRTHANNDGPSPAGYLIECDVPIKQFILSLNEAKPKDKRFVVEDLDATHLLVKTKARAEIERKVEEFQDGNVYSAIERVGEDLDMS